MGEIIDKVKEKAKDVKDKVVDNTKDVVNTAKDSTRTPSIAYTNSPEIKYKEIDLDIENRKIDAPITELRKEKEEEEEKLTIPTNIKEHKSATAFESERINQIGQQYNYKENTEFSNPYMIGLELWQNYYIKWMNFYNEFLNSSAKMIKEYGKKP